MLRITFNELVAGEYQTEIESFKPLFGSYPKLLREVLGDQLTAKQRRYVLLYYSKGMTAEQIAKACGVNKSTVSRTLKRARERLRSAIKCELIKRACTPTEQNIGLEPEYP